MLKGGGGFVVQEGGGGGGEDFFFFLCFWCWFSFYFGRSLALRGGNLKNQKSWRGVGGVFLLEVQYSILKSLISTCVLSYVGSKERIGYLTESASLKRTAGIV